MGTLRGAKKDNDETPVKINDFLEAIMDGDVSYMAFSLIRTLLLFLQKSNNWRTT